MDNYKIEITQRAFLDITECVSFVKNVSVEAANELYREIINAINSLCSFPNMFHEIEGLKIRENKVRKMPIHQGRYVIIYKVEKNAITIYDVLDTRKDSYILKL